MAIYRGSGGSGDATNDATVTAVQTYATQAATSATNAATSATNAATSASGAATSATNAANSATTAAGQATTAAGHASSASTYATNSSLSADDAADSAAEAQQYASEANDSEIAAALSASDAEASATAAANSAATSTGAVDDALALYGDAAALSDAVADAQAAETNALNYADQAFESNSDAENHAALAAISANSASASASAADADATSASIDADEAQAAATAAQAAVGYATAIYGSLADIQEADANVTANRDAAAASATSASNSASTATTQAGIATTQANAAAASAAAASAVVLSNEPVRPTVRPTLLLDFANTEQLDPRITFSRPTTARYYDADTSVKAEENLIPASQSIVSGAYWTTGSLTATGNSSTAPDGTTTASLLVPDTSSNYHIIYNAITVAAGSTTVSFYAKPSTYNFVYLRENLDGTYSNTFFNVSTGALGTVASGRTATITAVANGYYRCTVTATAVAGSRGFNFGVCSADNTPVFTGNGTAGAYIWGAQLEQRSTVTAYTATTTAAITNYIPVLLTQQSNEARFDHNPTTRESLGLLIEEQRTNLQIYSSDFSNATWVTSASTVTSSADISPDGTQNATKLVPTATGPGNHYIRSSGITTTVSTSYTTSIYVRAAEYSSIWLRLLDNGGNTEVASSFFSVSGSGSVLSTGTGTASITAVGNGWFRCSITGTATVGGTTFAYFYVTNGTTNSITGNGYSGIFVWGAQLEAGAFATSYIPTVASQVTRSADSASMTGTNFSSWYNQSQGTVYAEIKAFSTSTFPGIYAFDDGTTNNAILAYYSSTIVANARVNASNVFTSASSSIATTPTNYKLSMSYVTSSYASVFNGGTPVTQASGAVPPSLNRLQIGLYNNAYLNSTIKKIAYYPVACTSAQLQGVTTV